MVYASKSIRAQTGRALIPGVNPVEPKTLTFTLERETRTTARYRENLRYEEGHPSSLPPAIGTLIVQKWLIGENPPRTLVVTISGE